MSAVAMMSLTAIGQPSIGERGRACLYRRVAASAAFRAPRASSVTNALSVLSCLEMASRQRSRNRRGVVRPSRISATARTKDTGSGRLRGTEMLIEELQRALPRLGGGGGVLLQSDGVNNRIVARKRVSRIVAMEGVLGAGGVQLLFELSHLLDVEEAVVECEMAHHRCLDFRGVHVFERRETVPRDHGIRFGDEDRCENRQCAAHAIAGDADLRA